MKFEFLPIAYAQTLFKDRFAVPRQPGLAEDAKGLIKFNKDPDLKTALRRLDEFSHLWIIFVFHEHGGKKWKPSVRPPRLGGSEKVGVLSSRSPHRPNPIGISAVKIEKIDLDAKGGPEIYVDGIDLIDGTPILDIKPYIKYADSIPEAHAGWAEAPIMKFPVEFSRDSEKDLKNLPDSTKLKKLIVQILQLDPRPAFQKRKFPAGDEKSLGKKYGFDLLKYDVKFELTIDGFSVQSIQESKK